MAKCAAVSRITRKHSLPYLPDLHSAEEDVEFFTNRVFAANTVLAALDAANRIVGFIAFGEGWVNHLYVLPDFQGLGIGGQLLQRAKEEVTCLKLWTFQRNQRALRFYESRGFLAVRQTDGAENEEREPDVLLQWQR